MSWMAVYPAALTRGSTRSGNQRRTFRQGYRTVLRHRNELGDGMPCRLHVRQHGVWKTEENGLSGLWDCAPAPP